MVSTTHLPFSDVGDELSRVGVFFSTRITLWTSRFQILSLQCNAVQWISNVEKSGKLLRSELIVVGCCFFSWFSHICGKELGQKVKDFTSSGSRNSTLWSRRGSIGKTQHLFLSPEYSRPTDRLSRCSFSNDRILNLVGMKSGPEAPSDRPLLNSGFLHSCIATEATCTSPSWT